MQQSLPNFKKVSKILSQVIAAFFLIFVLADLAVDVLSPEHCGGEMFGLQNVAQASLISSHNEDNIEVLSPFSDNHSSTSPETDDGCCFCCCTHLLLNKIVFIPLFEIKALVSKPSYLSQPLSPPQSIFHPPRLI